MSLGFPSGPLPHVALDHLSRRTFPAALGTADGARRSHVDRKAERSDDLVNDVLDVFAGAGAGALYLGAGDDRRRLSSGLGAAVLDHVTFVQGVVGVVDHVVGFPFVILL